MKNVCILSTVHTAVGSFSGVKAKPESVIYYNNTKYGVDDLDQMAKAYFVRGGIEDGQFWSSITSSTCCLADINYTGDLGRGHF